MPGGTRAQLGNELFSQTLFLTVTPPATVTTAVITQQTVNVAGILPGDLFSWNMTTFVNPLIQIDNMLCVTPGVLTINWASAGATISSPVAQAILVEVTRAENTSLGLSSLPSSVQ
jgi:hypothetical protein